MREQVENARRCVKADELVERVRVIVLGVESGHRDDQLLRDARRNRAGAAVGQLAF